MEDSGISASNRTWGREDRGLLWCIHITHTPQVPVTDKHTPICAYSYVCYKHTLWPEPLTLCAISSMKKYTCIDITRVSIAHHPCTCGLLYDILNIEAQRKTRAHSCLHFVLPETDPQDKDLGVNSFYRR